MNAPTLLEPKIGMVVRFAYRWVHEVEAIKDRPACVALVRQVPDPGDDDPGAVPKPLKEVVYLPITSKPPLRDKAAVEIPPAVISRLRLTYPRCWIIVSQCNVQYWPNDIAKIHGSNDEWSYGFLPPHLFTRVVEVFRNEIIRRRANIINVQFRTPKR